MTYSKSYCIRRIAVQSAEASDAMTRMQLGPCVWSALLACRALGEEKAIKTP